MDANKDMKNMYRCSVEATVDVAGGKWKPLILHYLMGGTRRFGELRSLIGGVTQRSLTLQLRDLESRHIIRREVFAEVPPRVEYSLTEFGRTLGPVLHAMKIWGDTYVATTLGVPDRDQVSSTRMGPRKSASRN